MSSRIVRSSNGRALWAVVTVPAPGQDAGFRYRVLGDACPCAEPGFMFTGTPTGRLNTETEPRRNGRDPVLVDAVER